MKSVFVKFDRLPIRIKLTIWYTLSFMVVMAFSFVSFFLVTRNLLLSKIDSAIKSQSEEICALLNDQTISPASKELILRTFQITKTNFVLILNRNNEIVVQSQPFPVEEKLLVNLTNAVSKSPQFTTQEKSRFFISPLYSNDSLLGTVIVGDSISAIDEAFSVLFNTLTLIFFLFLLPLILVSFLEADISLLPLRDLANRMNMITTKNLSLRVDTLNPKDEIGEVSTAFNKLLDRIQKGFVKERQLIHDVSHQLKTPLTAVQSEIEIGLAKPRTPVAYQNILKDILNDTSRINNLLKDMMNFAWAASDNQEQHFSKQNLSIILEEASEITQQMGESQNLSVVTSIIPNIYVLGHREKLFQIFMSILENAVKYSIKNGRIWVQASTSGNKAKIIIKDNGIGISKRDLPHIFERFYRGKNHIDEGSGLGLSIASALVKAHKGTIEVNSQRHKGSTFIITLPLSNKETSVKSNRITVHRPHVRTFIRKQFRQLGKNRTEKAKKMKKTS